MEFETIATGIRAAKAAAYLRIPLLLGIAVMTALAAFGAKSIGGGWIPWLMVLAFGTLAASAVLLAGDTSVTVDRVARVVVVEGPWRGQSRRWPFDEIEKLSAKRGAGGDTDADTETKFWRMVLQTRRGRLIDLPIASSESNIRAFAEEAQAIITQYR